MSTEGTSRSLQALRFAPADTMEGLGFVGLGALVLLVAAVTAAVMGQRLDRLLRRRLVWLLVVTRALGLFATFPVIHLVGREVVDLNGTPFALTFLGDVLRANGRFVWALGYLVVLASAGFVLAIPSRGRLLVLVPAVLLQAVDLAPYVIPQSDPAVYEHTVSVLRDEQARRGDKRPGDAAIDPVRLHPGGDRLRPPRAGAAGRLGHRAADQQRLSGTTVGRVRLRDLRRSGRRVRQG